MESSSWGRLVGVIVSPIKTFESIAQRPTWAVALIVLVAAQLMVSLVATPKIDMAQEVRESVEARGQELTEEQIEQAVAGAEGLRWVFAVAGVVFGIAFYFLLGLIFWLLLRFVGDSDFSYPASLAALTHGFMPWLISSLLTLPILLRLDSVSGREVRSGLLASHLGGLAPDDAPAALRSLLESVDLFSFWTVALLIVGYAAIARTRRATVAWIVGSVWVLYVLGKVGLAALFG